MGNDSSAVVGIDLGTTYSCVSAIDELGNPVVGKNKTGSATTPSVVHFPIGREPSECEVGQIAKDSAVVEPDRTALLFKPLMGKRGVSALTLDGEMISPQEASAYVLKKITDDYVERYGTDIAGVVITVPAHFGQQEREATVEAGEMAGLNVLGIVQEPVAAAVFYGVCETGEDGDFLVYDLGGGTFDVTAVSVHHGEDTDVVEVICVEGDHELGGRLWDDRVIEYLADEYREQKNVAGELSAYSMQALRTAAEDAKQRLSETDETPVSLMLEQGPARIMLSRELFDDLTSDLLANTIDLTRKALENAELKGHRIDRILLVGGSTWMPQVKEALQRNFPNLILERTDPDEAVAKGAAICAMKRMVDSVDTLPQGEVQGVVGKDAVGAISGRGLELGVVTSKSYGVKATFSDGIERISNLILKNHKIDKATGVYEKTKSYKTLEGYPMQVSVGIEVYENDEEVASCGLNDGRMVVSQSFDLEEFRLPADSPITVTFSLSEEGLLHIRAVEPKNGKEIRFEKKVLGLTPEEKAKAKARVTGIAADD